MRIPKSIAIIFCVGVFLAATNMKADEWNKETKITFSGPVQIENTQLPAGTYVFKLADTTDRHVVQIFNEDQTQVIATILAIPDYRVEPTGKTVVRFAETNGSSEVSGEVPENGVAIKEWFYPGDNSGNEFKVTPQIAEAQPEPAPVATPEPPPPSPAAEPPQPPAPAAAAPAAPEPPATPQEAQPAPEPPTAEPQAAPSQLPQTASQMPLVGLIGLISLASAGSLHLILKKSA
jgi:outer membrane biosynthesis protein TonB